MEWTTERSYFPFAYGRVGGPVRRGGSYGSEYDCRCRGPIIHTFKTYITDKSLDIGFRPILYI